MTYSHPHILVVEDEPLVRQLICDILADLGAVVTECDRADSGFEYLECSGLLIPDTHLGRECSP